jgi:hypothetical protein
MATFNIYHNPGGQLQSDAVEFQYEQIAAMAAYTVQASSHT